MKNIVRMVCLAAAIGVAGCANFQPFVPDTAQMPAGGLGGGLDPDVTAVNLAYWAFADSGRTAGRPIEGARAAASMDYIAGQLYTSPRWSNLDALTKEQLLQGRVEVRAALDVAPTATSQQVVDALTGAGNALAANDQGAALQILGRSGVFTTSPADVLARLGNLPFMRMANVSTSKAANELFQNDSDRSN